MQNSTQNPATTTSVDTQQIEELLRITRDMSRQLHRDPSRQAHIHPGSLFDRDLGLDSLARAELIARIERTLHISLPEEAYREANSLGDILHLINLASPASIIQSTAQPQDSARLVQVPSHATTLPAVLEWYAEQAPDLPHIQFYDESSPPEPITIRTLAEKARIVAAALRKLGIKKGERIALMLPTSDHYFYTFLGIILAGGIPVPLYPPVRLSQLEEHVHRHQKILSNCQATFLITDEEIQRVAKLLRGQSESLKEILSAEQLLTHNAQQEQPESIDANDIALIQYTSGSTGAPKGVVLTHAQLLANIRAIGQALQPSSQDTCISWLPLYHDMGLIGMWLGSLYFGPLLVVMPPIQFLSRPERWLWAIHQFRGKLTTAPNFAYELCMKNIKDEFIKGLDLSSLRAVLNGAEPVSPLTLTGFSKRFAPYGLKPDVLLPVYGLAEAAVALTFPPLGRGWKVDTIQRDVFLKAGHAVPALSGDPNPLNFVACGYPLPGYELRIMDRSGRELPDRYEGHLQFRGPSATQGYYNNAAENARLFDGSWLNTGDLAYLVHGEIYITGRSKDIVIRGGRNIYPQELEELIGDMADVRKGCVAAFAASDPQLASEKLVVVAETRQREESRLRSLKAAIRIAAENLIGLPPDDILLVPPHSVLKTSSGKIRRSATRELYERGMLGSPPRAIRFQLLRLYLDNRVAGLQRKIRQGFISAQQVYAWSCGVLGGILIASLAILIPSYRLRFRVVQEGLGQLLKVMGISIHVQESIPLPTEPCVFVVNHASYVDVFVLIATLKRPASFVAKGELARSRWMHWLLRLFRTEFIERFDATQSLKDLQSIIAHAKAGGDLIFFPEGTFTRTPGIYPFQMGAFVAAAHLGAPIIPVALTGTRHVLPPDQWTLHHGTVEIHMDHAIYPVRGLDASEIWNEAIRLRDATRASILLHCQEPDRGQEKSPLAALAEAGSR